MDDDEEMQRDLVFAERETGPLLMDLAVPDAAGPVGVVVWLHGGGWFTGDRHLGPDPEAFAQRSGLAMATIEYRLSGQALFPAQLHDVRAAVRHLRAHAGDLGVDPDAIGLWGSSAGGHLAALAGVTGHLAVLPGEDVPGGGPSAAVTAVMEGYGPVDLARVVAEFDLPVPALAGANAPEARLIGGPPADRPDAARSASPLTYVSAAAPPFLIAHGTADVLVRSTQSELLHRALLDAGAVSTLVLLEGYRHGFLNPPGSVEIEGPRVMDDGRLETEGEAPARRFTAAVPDGEDVAFSLAAIDGFFREWLPSTA